MRSAGAPDGDEGCDGDWGEGGKKAEGMEYERLGRGSEGPSGGDGDGERDLSDHVFVRLSELESELRRLCQWNGGHSLAGVDGGVRGELESRTSNLRETYASEFIGQDSWWTTANPSLRLLARRH